MSGVATLLSAIHPSLAQLSGIPLFVFVAVFVLTVGFLVGYAIKATQVWRQMLSVLRAVSAMAAQSGAPDPTRVREAFKREPFRHLWNEYEDTLHEVKKGASGATALIEVRATVPAESLFTRETLVDSRLFDEFTRHLPGILTGLGIIGTFAGLLDGLSSFKPTPIEAAVNGLKPLLEGVQHAFVASGTAIACAMLVVFISRLTLAYLYRLVERLTHAIDSLYATGAGEEYLARLVKSSEQSAATTAQLKDALVEDLNKMMTNLVERQIAAHEASNLALGKRIGDGISSAMAEPMRRIGDAIEGSTRGNGEQVSNMLETLLTGFMAKLEDTFGGQMRGINEQLQRSMEALAAVQGSMQGLLRDISSANDRAIGEMSGTLEEAMRKSAENQRMLTDQMRDFMQSLATAAAEEQSKSKQSMDDAVVRVLGEVATAVDRLESLRKTAAEEEAGRNQRLGAQTTELLGGLTTHVDTLLATVSKQVAETQRNIDALGKVSLRAIEGMTEGAGALGQAAQRFETAGGSVTGVLDRSTALTNALTASSGALQTAATAVQRGFEQYDSTRKTVDSQVATLTGLVELARKEAGISQDLLASIAASAEAMRSSAAEGREHLEKVNEALVKAFSTFGTSLVSQVKSTIAETDRHLAQGTGHLNGVVQELANAVHRMKRA